MDILARSLVDFKPQELSNILWSFAKSGETNPGLFQALGHHIHARSLKDFKLQDFSNIVWAYATAGVSLPKLF